MNDVMRQMKPFLWVTDILFLLYWFVSLLILAGLLNIPNEYLYSDYNDPAVVAWNWSFFPLDVAFSICGLMAIRRFKQDHPSWVMYAAVSLCLTFCAGLMAIAFWTIRLEFDPSWWIPNFLIMVWPLYFLPKLFRGVRLQPA